MWDPGGADIQTRFTGDATSDGLAPDLVDVAQGDVTRTAGGVHIERDFLDIDLPLVAMRGLERAEAHGVEFYSRDLSAWRSQQYIKHSEAAARYFEAMFGPLRSEEHTSELQSLMRISYAVFCLKKKNNKQLATTSIKLNHPL